MIKEKKENLTPEPYLRPRPLWQRLIYPFVGIILILLGIILWLTPVVMGFPLIIIGVPLVFCFHPRLELWGRRRIRMMWVKLRKKIKRK